VNVPHRVARTGARTDRITPIDHVIADRIALQQHAARLCGPLPAATPTALLIVELADTGAVSGLLGRPVSDGDVLDEVACQMADVVPPSGELYRLSFNQFAVLIAGESDDEFALVAEATETAYRLHRAFQTPTRNGAVLTVMSSIGLAYFPYQAKTWEELLDFADAAMSYSRSHRGTKVTTYGKHARHLAHRRETVARLNDALRNDEFSLRYQPIVALQDGAARISGVEALIRWNDGGKLVLPNEFIPLLEWSGSIGDVGAWVLDTATREMRDVGADGVPLTLSVNVSLPELADRRYLVNLLGILERNRFDPQRLVLEVTESVAMSDLETVAAVLNGAGQVGIRIAIDDFGTGS
jgi:predicted signal transduction protein with EAL and GGDEF domain